MVEFPRAAKKSGGARVLVVDDEPLVRWAVSEALGRQGYEVIEAGDGASAIASLDHEAPVDAVLLDVWLPDCEDLRVLGDIHRLVPETPVIVMTSFPYPELGVEARRLGAIRVVRKPFDMDDVAPLVASALDRQPR